jgi:hypothetical protein
MKLTTSPALSTPSTAVKRKAASFDDDDDAENVDPVIFLSPKRSKCPDGSSKDAPLKPVNFFLTPKASASASSLAQTGSPRRPILPARSPLPKLSTSSITKPSPLSAPAGRSPTRKRAGILNRRRTASPFTRVDPPKFAPSGGLGFSIDAALSGTIPSYAARQCREKDVLPVSLHQSEVKDSWFFDIHEDTPDEEATNLMEHSTCTLDISSDEESAARMRDERGKENVPPLDDVSQTRGGMVSESVEASSVPDLKTRSSRRRRDLEEGAIEIDRSPLGEMPAEDFYSEGCDGESVFIVPGEQEEDDGDSALEQDSEHLEEINAAPMGFDFCVEGELGVDVSEEVVDALMRKSEWDVAPKAALLEPIEKAEEGFQVWESGSAKGEGDE